MLITPTKIVPRGPTVLLMTTLTVPDVATPHESVAVKVSVLVVSDAGLTAFVLDVVTVPRRQ